MYVPCIFIVILFIICTIKCTHTHTHTHTHIYYKTHTYTHPHSRKQVKTTTRYTPNEIVAVQSSTLSIRSPFCTWYTPCNFLWISTYIIFLKILKCVTFHKYWTSTVVKVLLLVSAQTLFYLTTHVTATLRLF